MSDSNKPFPKAPTHGPAGDADRSDPIREVAIETSDHVRDDVPDLLADRANLVAEVRRLCAELAKRTAERDEALAGHDDAHRQLGEVVEALHSVRTARDAARAEVARACLDAIDDVERAVERAGNSTQSAIGVGFVRIVREAVERAVPRDSALLDARKESG